MKIRAVLGAATLLVLLAGCGGEEPDPVAGDVASIASAAPAKSATEAPADERPLIRTDTSEADEQRMWDVWEACLADNGMPSKRDLRDSTDDAGEPVAGPASDDAKAKTAEAACRHKEPEQVWERAKRTDPAYADKLRDWVTCVRSHGVDAWESDGFLTFESLPPENQMKKVDECQDKAFGTGA